MVVQYQSYEDRVYVYQSCCKYSVLQYMLLYSIQCSTVHIQFVNCDRRFHRRTLIYCTLVPVILTNVYVRTVYSETKNFCLAVPDSTADACII